MWKDRPELTDEEIETILAEAENERRSTVTDPIQQANELAKRDYPELAKTSPAAARAKVWAERPDLREAHEQAEEAPAPVFEHTVEKGAPALAKRDAAVAELRKIYPHEPEAMLRVRALRENPEIYEEYRRLSAS